jgi:hypothetical protein
MKDKTFKVNTECQKCYFAQFEGMKQTGCSLGRLEKFIGHNKAEKLTSEFGNQEYYVITTICNTYRPQSWKFKTGDFESKKTEALDAVKFRSDYLLLLYSKDDIPKLLLKIKEIEKGEIKPRRLIIVCQDYLDIDVLNENIALPFQVVKIMLNDTTIEEKIDIAFKHVKAAYYTVYDINKYIPPTYLSTLNHVINEDMQQAVLFDNGENHGSTFSSMLHKIYGGNKAQSLRSKIIEADQDQETNNIYTL